MFIVFLNHVFNLLKPENERSHSHDVIGNVAASFSRVCTFGKCPLSTVFMAKKLFEVLFLSAFPKINALNFLVRNKQDQALEYHHDID